MLAFWAPEAMRGNAVTLSDWAVEASVNILYPKLSVSNEII